MPKLKNRLPRNCRDRNQAFSWHNGKRIYHGVWGTPEAEKSYRRFIAALVENPNRPTQMGKDSDVLVSELADNFLVGIESRMDKDAVIMFNQAVGYLIEIYGELAVNEFSPKKLKAVRSLMVKAGTLCRNQINRYTGYIKRIFAWGVEEEVVESSVSLAIKAVKNLRKDEEGTFDHPEKEEVPFWVIAATLPFLAPMVAAMVQIQWMLGMRPSEVFKMRVGDIDRTRENGLWYYVPGSYKSKVLQMR
jgi:integrase